jgi:hypothetical protein
MPPEILRVSHPTKPYLWVIPIDPGALLRAVFSVNAEAKQNSAGFLAFLNAANQTAVVARYWVHEETLAVAAWYPSPYNKQTFGTFFEQFLTDLWTTALKHPDETKRFLT